MADENNNNSTEPKLEEFKGKDAKALNIWIILVVIGMIALTGIGIWLSYQAYGNKPLENTTKNNQTITLTPVPPLQDVSVPMCAQLDKENKAQNNTMTSYYMSAEYCVFEVKGYNQEYYIHCENNETKAEILLRPINLTVDFVQSRFPACKVLPVVR